MHAIEQWDPVAADLHVKSTVMSHNLEAVSRTQKVANVGPV